MPLLTTLRALQETLDENKENMPEGLYVSLCASMASLYADTDRPTVRNYYAVQHVAVIPTSSYRVQAHQVTTICEETSRGFPNDPDGWLEALRTAHITRDMAQNTNFPITCRDGRGGVVLICGCELIEDSVDDESDI